MTSPRRSKPEPFQPPAEFGRIAIDLARSVNKTPQDLVEGAGYESKKTLSRLVNGEGTFRFAVAIRETLIEWGADVSKLPQLVDEPAEPEDPRLREWNRLGVELRGKATDERFDEELEEVRDLIRSHLKVAGTGRIAKPQP